MGVMEFFVDKYMPITIQHLIGQSIKAIVTKQQHLLFQNYELEQFKKLNNSLLSNETP